MNIAIIGTGYVGLVSGVCLASKGHNVICVDLNPDIVKRLNKSKPTIYEKNLEFFLKKTIAQKKFRATTNLIEALNFATLVIVAVGTPQNNESIDLSYIKKVCQDIGNYMSNNKKYITIIIKSTVIPGTTDTFVRKEIEKYSKKKIGEFGLGMNPEFLREGNAVEDFLCPDRIVLGYETEKTLIVMKKLYEPWKVDKIYVNTRTAELIKYANNVLLATQISTLNEIANLSSALGNIDITQVVKGIHLDKRWNPIINNKRLNPRILKYLIPGCGFGGSCFPKDLNALKAQGRKCGIQMRVIDAVLNVNENQPYQVIKILESEIGNISDKRILILGLSFNPETDDIRNSPAIKICNQLIKKNAIVSAHDPKAIKNFKINFTKISSKISFVNNWKMKIKNSDIIIITTPWKEYLSLTNFNLNGKIVFDGKKAFSIKSLNNAKYLSIG
jgi:UDPglucose 6-dehydrogenase